MSIFSAFLLVYNEGVISNETNKRLINVSKKTAKKIKIRRKEKKLVKNLENYLEQNKEIWQKISIKELNFPMKIQLGFVKAGCIYISELVSFLIQRIKQGYRLGNLFNGLWNLEKESEKQIFEILKSRNLLP